MSKKKKEKPFNPTDTERGMSRVLFALDLLNSGYIYHDVAVEVANKYDISKSHAYSYARAAVRYREKLVANQMKNAFSDLYSKFMNLFLEAKQGGNIDLANKILPNVVKSFGLNIYTPIPVNDNAMGNQIEELVFKFDTEKEESE